MFDFNQFAEICTVILPLIILGGFFFSFFIGLVAERSELGMHIMALVGYICAIGIVIHEVAHHIFCILFNVQVKEAKYFYVNRHKGATEIGGYLNLEEVRSITVGIFLGIAPLLVNGLLVALIIYFSPMLGNTPYWWLTLYLGIALAIGARPSSEDLGLCLKAAKRAPGRALLEISLYITFGAILYALVAIWRIEVWGIALSILIFFIILVLQGRVKATGFTAPLGRI